MDDCSVVTPNSILTARAL